MSLAALPNSAPSLPSAASAAPSSRRWLWWVIPVTILALIAVGYVVIARTAPAAAGGTIDLGAAQFYYVTPQDFEVKINQKGELQAVNNIDIVCMVEGQTTITTIVKEGSTVKKGQVLVTLDGSAIKQKIDDTMLEVQKAEADLLTSKEMKDIQESQNAANLEAAQVALDAAKLDLQAYNEGIYPQSLQNAQTALEKSKITLKQSQEDYAQTQSLFNKSFVTATDVKKAEIAMTDAANAVEQAETALKVLTQYTHAKDLADKRTAVSQAEQKLIRTQRENAANMTQKNVDVNAKDQNLLLIKRRLEHYQDQFAACTITAPADGLVVYSSTGDRGQQNPIQEGAQVRERQPLLRLPDTSSMKAVVRVQEAQVPKLAEGQRARVTITGVPRALGATVSKISVLADNSQRWWNPDLKEYPVDLTLDETPASLKPGLDAQAEILVARAPNVLAVKLASLYSAGEDTYVFVRDNDRVRPEKVKVGLVNDSLAEVKSGLTGGQQVLLLGAGQGRELLEQAGIKVQPSTRPSDFDGMGAVAPAKGKDPRGGADRRRGEGSAQDNADPSPPRGGADGPRRAGARQPRDQQPTDSAAPVPAPTPPGASKSK